MGIAAAAVACHGATITFSPEGTLTVVESTAPLGNPLRYLSGGDGLTGIAGAWPAADSPATAASGIDHKWLQGIGNMPVVWVAAIPLQTVFVVPGVDHGPSPGESLEFVIQGSNDQVSWNEGAITTVYRDGFDTADTALGHSDDLTSLWKFNQSYTYFRAVTGDHLSPHFSSDDYEIDGLAAPASVPEPASLALLGLGLLALRLGRRRLS